MRNLRKITRAAITVTLGIAALSGFAQEPQNFPTKPVRLVVGVSAGSQWDKVARLIGPKLSESWGQPVVLENRPGAGTTLAARIVAKATPDGNTLLLINTAFSVSAALNPSLSYDPITDFAGVTAIGVAPLVWIAAPGLGIKTSRELVALAKTNPGKLIVGSVGAGTGPHLAGEKFRLTAGIKVVNVAFKGGPETLIEVLAGRVHYGIVGLGIALPLIKSGKLVALAVNTSQRSTLLPEVETINEVLPAYQEGRPAGGLLAPAGTPRPIREQISRDVAGVLGRSEVMDALLSDGMVIKPSTPDEYEKMVRHQIKFYSDVVKMVGLRPR